jgi:hypothetical protein
MKPMGNASKLRIKWVSDLIEPSTKMWKEDWLAWSYDQSGMFTVKSAYRLGLDLKERGIKAGGSSRPAGEREMWDVIWKTNVPPKI